MLSSIQKQNIIDANGIIKNSTTIFTSIAAAVGSTAYSILAVANSTSEQFLIDDTGYITQLLPVFNSIGPVSSGSTNYSHETTMVLVSSVASLGTYTFRIYSGTTLLYTSTSNTYAISTNYASVFLPYQNIKDFRLSVQLSNGADFSSFAVTVGRSLGKQ
jgi:hypothetical protein